MLTNWNVPYHAVFGLTDADHHDPATRGYVPRAQTGLGDRLRNAEQRICRWAEWCGRLEKRLATLERQCGGRS
jgi:hypothetical protein